MFAFLFKVYDGFFNLFTYLTSFVLLALRLHFGWSFINAAQGKFAGDGPWYWPGTEANPGMVQMFGNWGIPFPELMTPFIGYVELIGGLLLMIGLFARPAALFLVCTMIGAFATAHWDAVMGLFGSVNPGLWFRSIIMEANGKVFMHALASFMVLVMGAGWISLDYFFGRACCPKDK